MTIFIFWTFTGNCYDDEIVPQEGKSCKHLKAWKNICDGSKTDCLLKGKEKCNSDPNCHGIMYHPGYWSKDNKGVLSCTSKTLRDQPPKDWSVYLKICKCKSNDITYLVVLVIQYFTFCSLFNLYYSLWCCYYVQWSRILHQWGILCLQWWIFGRWLQHSR